MPNAPFSTAPPQDVGRGKPHAERGCAGEGAEFALPVPERLPSPKTSDRASVCSLCRLRRHLGTRPALHTLCSPLDALISATGR
jgi:hypothetical protein